MLESPLYHPAAQGSNALDDAGSATMHGWPAPGSVTLSGEGDAQSLRITYGEQWIRQAGPTLLDRFAGLANDKSGSRIQSFVRRFGSLQLDAAGTPRPKVAEDESREPVHWYRRYGGLVALVLRMAETARRGFAPASDDCDQARDLVTFLEKVDQTQAHWHLAAVRLALPDPSLNDAAATWAQTWRSGRSQRLLSGLINWWMDKAQIRLVLSWPDDASNPVIAYSGWLWGAIAFEMASHILRGSLAPTCDLCGRTRDPSLGPRQKAPKHGQAVYCGRPECERERLRRRRLRSPE